MSGPISDAWFHRVKSATRDLVKLAGGVVRAGEIAGVSKTEVSRWQSAGDSDIISIPGALALEADCGVPLVTTAMAALHGRTLSDDAAVRTAGCVMQGGGELAHAASETVAAIMTAAADGEITRAEAEIIRRAVSKVQLAATNVMAGCAPIQAGESAALRAVS